MKVIIDLHAAEGSQNGNDHSGTRDGYTEWGDSYIPNTVQVIDFLAERFPLLLKNCPFNIYFLNIVNSEIITLKLMSEISVPKR